jgi:site-specific DNA recombinase
MDIGTRKKALGYIRISDKKQTDGESPDTQREIIQQYADRNNIEIVEWFYDEARSGKNAERQELKNMLQFSRKYKGKIDHIIVYKMNRASRDMPSYIESVSMVMRSQGMSIRSATEPVDETKMGRFMEHLLVLLGQLDNDTKTEFTVDNMSSLARQGYWQHGSVVGYDICKLMNDSNKPRPSLIPNDMAPKVKAVLERFSQADISQAELTRFADNLGLRTPKGKKLNETSIRRLLERPIYMGYVSDSFTDNEPVPGKHPAIISPETFYLNQRILAQATNKRSGIDYRVDNPNYPLKKFLLCHNCLKPLYASAPKTGGGGHSPRYHCARPGCRGKVQSVAAAEVHSRYLSLMHDIKPSTGVLKLYKEVLIRQAIKETGNLNKDIQQLRNKLNEIADTRTATNTKYSIDQLSNSDRDDVVAKLDQEKYQVVEELAGLERQQTVQETAIEYAINFMTNSAKLWEDAALEHRQRFQSLIFKEGLILNTQTLEFGTTKISPLYRYAPNKKDLSVIEKSLVVTSRGIEPRLSG